MMARYEHAEIAEAERADADAAVKEYVFAELSARLDGSPSEVWRARGRDNAAPVEARLSPETLAWVRDEVDRYERENREARESIERYVAEREATASRPPPPPDWTP